MADDKVKIDIRRVRQEPTIYEKNSLYLISDIGEENFVLIVTDPEGNPKKIEAEELSEYAKLTDLPETSTLQELLNTVPEDIGKLQTPLRLNEWADSKYALKNHTHIWGDITDRPTKLTDFQNDLANYGDWITEDDLEGYATEDWVEGKGYITSYEDTTYTAGEGLDLDEGEFSLTQDAIDALGEAHTHPNKDIIDDITSEHVSDWDSAFQDSHTHTNKSVLDGIDSDDMDNWGEAYNNSHTHLNKSTLDGIQDSNISNWDEAYAKAHDHSNKTLLDSLEQGDLNKWNEAYDKAHTHSNKTVLDGILESDVDNWDSKIDGTFADAKYALNTVEVRGTNGLTGGGALTANRNIELSTDTITNISKGVAAHAYTLDDVTSNGNSTSVKLTGDSVFSNTLGKDYTQMEDLWKAGFSIQFLSNEYKLVLRRKDDFIISEVDLSSLVSGDLEVSIDDTDSLDPEIVFKQNGVEVGRVPASSLLAGVVNSGELVGKEIHFKDRVGTIIINIDLSPVLDAKSDKETKISVGTGLSGGGTLAADRTISFNTTWGDARYQGKLIAGANVSISASNEISATDTKYTAGNGLTLSGTAFSLPVSITGTGTFVKTVTQSANGVSVVLGTPPDTNSTYSNMSLTELNTGTVTTARSISAKTLTDWGDGKFAPSVHTHTWAQITGKPTTFSPSTHTHTFASLTSKPTTIAGYGITDFNSLGDARYALRTRSITGTGGLTGGGNLTANRTLDLSSGTKSDIALGKTAHGWGDFRDFGLGSIGVLDSEIDNINGNLFFRTGSSNIFGNYGSGISLNRQFSDGGRIAQLHIATPPSGLEVSLKSRVKTGDGWSDVVELWHTGNLENPATQTWVNSQNYLQELGTVENVGGYLSLSNSNNLNLTSLSSRVRQNSLERYGGNSNIFTPYTTSAGSTGYPSSGGVGSGIRIERRSTNTNQTGFDIWTRGAGQSELYFKTFRGEDVEGSWNEFWHSGNLENPATEGWSDGRFSLKSHTHSISEVTGLQSALNSKAGLVDNNTFSGVNTFIKPVTVPMAVAPTDTINLAQLTASNPIALNRMITPKTQIIDTGSTYVYLNTDGGNDFVRLSEDYFPYNGASVRITTNLKADNFMPAGRDYKRMISTSVALGINNNGPGLARIRTTTEGYIANLQIEIILTRTEAGVLSSNTTTLETLKNNLTGLDTFTDYQSNSATFAVDGSNGYRIDLAMAQQEFTYSIRNNPIVIERIK